MRARAWVKRRLGIRSPSAEFSGWRYNPKTGSLHVGHVLIHGARTPVQGKLAAYLRRLERAAHRSTAATRQHEARTQG